MEWFDAVGHILYKNPFPWVHGDTKLISVDLDATKAKVGAWIGMDTQKKARQKADNNDIDT